LVILTTTTPSGGRVVVVVVGGASLRARASDEGPLAQAARSRARAMIVAKPRRTVGEPPLVVAAV
jgi:hypothetical protein